MFSLALYRAAFISVLIHGLIGCSGSGSSIDSGISTQSVRINTGNTGYTFISNKTGVITINWLPPTENIDDSALTDLSGYRIYFGRSPDLLTNSISINNPGLTSYAIENLNVNTTYYFTITAINSLSLQSNYSNIINITTDS